MPSTGWSGSNSCWVRSSSTISAHSISPTWVACWLTAHAALCLCTLCHTD